MASLSEAKNLGGIGAILALLSGLLFWVPYNAGIGLLIVGLVLMLIAVKNIANTVGDPAIYSSMMYSVILAIIGPVMPQRSRSLLPRHSSVLSAVTHLERPLFLPDSWPHWAS